MRSRSLRLDACLRSTRSGVADLGQDMWGFTDMPVRTVMHMHVNKGCSRVVEGEKKCAEEGKRTANKDVRDWFRMLGLWAST